MGVTRRKKREWGRMGYLVAQSTSTVAELGRANGEKRRPMSCEIRDTENERERERHTERQREGERNPRQHTKKLLELLQYLFKFNNFCEGFLHT